MRRSNAFVRRSEPTPADGLRYAVRGWRRCLRAAGVVLFALVAAAHAGDSVDAAVATEGNDARPDFAHGRAENGRMAPGYRASREPGHEGGRACCELERLVALLRASSAMVPTHPCLQGNATFWQISSFRESS